MHDIIKSLEIIRDRACTVRARINAIESTLLGEQPSQTREAADKPAPGLYNQILYQTEEIYRVLDDCIQPIQSIERILYPQEGTANAKLSGAPVKSLREDDLHRGLRSGEDRELGKPHRGWV